MKLTVTQATLSGKKSYGSFFTHILYSNLLNNHLIKTHLERDNYFDAEDIEDRTEGSAILELTFDKDYEVDNVKPSDYYANVPAWLVRLVSPRSRNRQE